MTDTPRRVPQWVTSWPEWFGIHDNVTVVPKEDYDSVVAELARVDGYDRYCDVEIKRLDRELAEAKADLANMDAENTRLLKAALPSLATQEETAWLIESVGGRWGTGYFWKGVGEYETWGVLAEAVRFTRKEDAERVIASLHLKNKRQYGHRFKAEYEACEHIWTDTAQGEGKP
jgi:hypothetical protein